MIAIDTYLKCYFIYIGIYSPRIYFMYDIEWYSKIDFSPQNKYESLE